MKRTVAYIKCRPQDADAWPVAEKYKIAFLGYPVYIDHNHQVSHETKFKNVLVDISKDDWRNCIPPSYKRGYRQQVASNANLVRLIDSGSFVMVPRPGNGLCHIGLVSGKFRIPDNPIWAKDYLSLRKAKNLESEYEYIGDLLQVFPIKEWRSVPFPMVPAWITYRLLSRNTAGVIASLPNELGDSYSTVKSLFDSAKTGRYKLLQEDQPIERRLLDWVSPKRLEHLIIDLLQLESKDSVTWHHIGGTGDGGVDGLAIDKNGKVVGALQCKWHHGYNLRTIEQGLINASGNKGWEQIVIAVLHGTQDYTPINTDIVSFWNRRKIAQLIGNNKKKLPSAKEFGII